MYLWPVTLSALGLGDWWYRATLGDVHACEYEILSGLPKGILVLVQSTIQTRMDCEVEEVSLECRAQLGGSTL